MRVNEIAMHAHFTANIINCEHRTWQKDCQVVHEAHDEEPESQEQPALTVKSMLTLWSSQMLHMCMAKLIASKYVSRSHLMNH